MTSALILTSAPSEAQIREAEERRVALRVAQENLYSLARRVARQLDKGGSDRVVMGEILRACVALDRAATAIETERGINQ